MEHFVKTLEDVTLPPPAPVQLQGVQGQGLSSLSSSSSESNPIIEFEEPIIPVNNFSIFTTSTAEAALNLTQTQPSKILDGGVQGGTPNSSFIMMDFSEIGILSLVSFISQLLMIFGGVVPYIPQYNEIYQTGNADGFSLYVCLALLCANILRIVFWFGRPFEAPLLIQSILMNMAMLLMIHLCVRTKGRSEIIKKKDQKFSGADDPNVTIPGRTLHDGLNAQHFWDWTDFQSYLECVFVFSIFGGFLMYFFSNVSFFVELVGFLSVFVEAMLGVPQFLRNYRSGTTRGMNRVMVIMWTCGDVFKTTYFIIRAVPIQFAICGCLQIGVDLAILAQVWLYSSSSNGGGVRIS